MSSVVMERFWSKVDASGDCWEWTGAKNKPGYGQVTIARRQYGVHRVAWEWLVGPIPEGMQIDHLCRNRGCLNPDHLEVVTVRENLRRGYGFAGRNARKTVCKRGHLFTEANTSWVPMGRNCLECRRLHARGAL